MTAQSNKHYTYVLLTENNKLYCGYTTDLEKRFKNHKAGTAAKYTRANKPIKIIYSKEYNIKRCALKAEYRFKHMPKTKKLAFLKGQGVDISSL